MMMRVWGEATAPNTSERGEDGGLHLSFALHVVNQRERPPRRELSNFYEEIVEYLETRKTASLFQRD